MQKAHKQFETYLAKHEGRYTQQKRAIAEAIFNQQYHFEVDELAEQIRKSVGRFSRATVYRTIKLLLDAGLIQKIPTRDGRVYYEKKLDSDPITHFICNVCGKIEELKDTGLNDRLTAICDQKGFSGEYMSLHVYGQCSRCLSAATVGA